MAWGHSAVIAGDRLVVMLGMVETCCAGSAQELSANPSLLLRFFCSDLLIPARTVQD